MLAFVTVVLTTFGLLYGYTGWRILAPLRLGASWNGAAAAVLALLMVMPFLLHGRHGGIPDWLSPPLGWAAYVALGFVLITWSLLVLRDVCWFVLLLGQRLATALVRRASPGTELADPARRLFLLNALNVSTLAVSTSMTGYGLVSARRGLRTVALTVPLPGLPPEFAGLRIAHWGDLHVGLTIRRDFVERVVDHCAALPADLIACTGDLADGDLAELERDVEPLARLRAPLGSFFVTGNHEYYHGDLREWLPHLRDLGFTVLLNEHRVLTRGSAQLVIAGIPDPAAGTLGPAHRPDASRAVAGAPPGAPRIFLAHQPRSIDMVANAGAALLLAGHTHGGQFVPWTYVVGLQQPYVAGLHRHGGTWIHVTRGAGYWGPPLRLGVPPEIALLTLEPAEGQTLA